MKRLLKQGWVFIFMLALFLGLCASETEITKFTVIKSSGAQAPPKDLVFRYNNGRDADSKSVPDCVNINTADIELLSVLSGIGEKMSKRIIDYRTMHGNFETVQDIMKVSGIGEKTFEDIKDYVIIE